MGEDRIGCVSAEGLWCSEAWGELAVIVQDVIRYGGSEGGLMEKV